MPTHRTAATTCKDERRASSARPACCVATRSETCRRCDSENVTNTLMAYITTRVSRLPCRRDEQRRGRRDPSMRMPFAVVSRSESDAKRRGSHESTAMLDMTRGPSMKPACAATSSSAPSDASTSKTKILPSGHAEGSPVAGEGLDQDTVQGLAFRRLGHRRAGSRARCPRR